MCPYLLPYLLTHSLTYSLTYLSTGKSAAWVMEQLIQISDLEARDGDLHVAISTRSRPGAAGQMQLEVDGYEPSAPQASRLERGLSGLGFTQAADAPITRVTVEVTPHLSERPAVAAEATVTTVASSASSGRSETFSTASASASASASATAGFAPSPTSGPSLRIVGWQRSAPEALLYIHGWNSGHKNAHEQLSQFLNLSRLGHHIRPFVFAWPCGLSSLSFWKAVEFASTSAETHAALASMVASLAAAGIRRLHIFAHSMGARLLMNALPALSQVRTCMHACICMHADTGSHAGSHACPCTQCMHGC